MEVQMLEQLTHSHLSFKFLKMQIKGYPQRNKVKINI